MQPDSQLVAYDSGKPDSPRIDLALYDKSTATDIATGDAYLPKGKVTTFAGSGKQGFLDGPSAKAEFYHPMGIALGSSGKVYVSEWANYRIRVISQGQVSTYAGNGQAGFHDGPALSAQFNHPRDIAFDKKGKLYVADYGNRRIRMVFNGQVSTVAGTGKRGYNNGDVSVATFDSPLSIAVDGTGNIYIADNVLVRKISGTTVSTYAGDGTKGHLDGPSLKAKFRNIVGIAVDISGRVYVLDYSRIRMISNGQVSTLAGGAKGGFLDGPVATAKFGDPKDIEVDATGNIYIADGSNNRIRLIAGGHVYTVAGSGTSGYLDGPAVSAQFNNVYDLVLDSKGKIYIADDNNRRIRLYTP